jgi:predicted O-methyltransferase YrrM
MIEWKELQRADEIPGWIFTEELITLAYLASQTPYIGKILEIGSWCGRSSRALLAGMNPRTKRQLHCVDTWSGGDGVERVGITGEIAKKIFDASLIDYIAGGRVKVFMGDYRKILPSLGPGTYSLVFIDGPHGDEHALPTVKMVMPLLAEQATIAIHDTSGGWPGAVKMLNAFYDTGEFEQGVMVKTLSFLERKAEVKRG